MGAEFGTHFEIALKMSLRENFFENFAILSETCVATGGAADPSRALGQINQKSHYKLQG